MTWLALLRSPLVWAACAALAAWLAWGQFQRANAASDALRAAQNASRVLAGVAVQEASAAAEWRDLYASIEGLPETFGCGDPVHRALGVVRDRRNPGGAD